MTSPLREMTAAARRMAPGDYTVRVSATSRDEVGELARAFNRMAERPRGGRPAAPRAGRQRQPRAAHAARRAAAPCSRTSSTASPSPTPRPCAPRSTRRERLGRWSATCSTCPGSTPAGAARPARTSRSARCSRPPSPRPGSAVATSRTPCDVSPPDLAVQGRPGPAAPARRQPARQRGPAQPARRHRRGHAPSAGDDRWQLEVTDEGPGIAPADRERVFERFGTARRHRRRRRTGLGLAIARWVTDLHGGTIRFVDPEPGEHGARVRADLPLDPTTRHAQEETRMTEPAPPAGPDAAPPPRRPRAAAVPSRRAVRRLLARRGRARQRPGAARRARRRRARRRRAAVPRPRARHVPRAARGRGASCSPRAGNRRDPFTLACAALCLRAVAAVARVRDAEWIAVLCLLAGAGLCAVGLVRGRTRPAFVLAVLAWPLAGLRGLPWLGRTLRPRHRPRQQARRCVRTVAARGDRPRSSSALLFASADALFAEWVGRRRPRPRVGRPALRRVRRCSSSAASCSPAATSRSTRRPSTAASGRPPGRAPVRVARAGAGRRRRVRAVPGRAGRRSSSAATTTSSGRPG